MVDMKALKMVEMKDILSVGDLVGNLVGSTD